MLPGTVPALEALTVLYRPSRAAEGKKAMWLPSVPGRTCTAHMCAEPTHSALAQEATNF